LRRQSRRSRDPVWFDARILLHRAERRFRRVVMEQPLLDTLTAWRRHLHSHPELTLREKETSLFVQSKLRELGVPFVAGVGGHGVVATLTRGSSNRSVGLRADMDALPIAETSGVPHASLNPGVMHACGHDGHTASLLGAAALLQQDTAWSGTVQFVFQPAEEGGGGAKSMIADGLFERFPMERIFGYHNWPGLEAGAVAVHDSAVMAAGNRLVFSIKGHGGHAALPHLTRDPMIAAAHLVLALQTVVSRETDPMDSVVITIGIIQGGTAANQVPGDVLVRGTMRVLRDDVRDRVEAAIHRVAAGVALTCGVEIEVTIPRGNPVTMNSLDGVAMASDAVVRAGLTLRRDIGPAMTGEDFAWFLQARPGAFVWIGNGPGDGGRELHNANYDYNDAILPAAAGYLAGVAKRALEG
jgi:amidohydrolase